MAAQSITLQNSTDLIADTMGTGDAGTIVAQTDAFSAINSTLSSSSTLGNDSAGAAGSVTIKGLASPADLVTLDNTTISTVVDSDKPGITPANISITSKNVILKKGTIIQADTQSLAPAGNIAFNVDTLTSNGGNDTLTNAVRGIRILSISDSENSDSGKAGTISIQGIPSDTGEPRAAQQVTLNNTGVNTRLDGGGGVDPGGNISIISNDLDLENGTALIASANLNATGNAGSVTLNVDTFTTTPGVVRFGTNNPLTPRKPGILIGAGALNPNAPNSAAGQVTIQGVNSTDSDSKAASHVTLNDALVSTLQIGDGQGGDIGIKANTLILKNGTTILADTSGGGNAGNIHLNVNSLTTTPGETRTPLDTNDPTGPTTGVLISSNSTDPSNNAGAAGSVTIEGLASPAEQITLNDTTIQTTIAGGEEDTPAANITLSAHDLALNNGTQITADTQGAAPAGSIFLNIGKLTSANNPDSVLISSSSTGATTTGNAGSVTIRGVEGDKVGQGTLAAPGVGTITLAGTDIKTEAEGTGEGGSITMASLGTMTLDHTTLSANVNQGTATDTSSAGITLTTPALHIMGGGLTAQTTGLRDAGAITLNTDQLTTAKGTTPVLVAGELRTRVLLSSSSTGENGSLADPQTPDNTVVDGNAGDVTIQGQGQYACSSDEGGGPHHAGGYRHHHRGGRHRPRRHH